MYLKRSGKSIGMVNVARDKFGDAPHVQISQVTKKFRGMGLGKKLYGEVIMREGALTPGIKTSKSAQRVWKSLYRRYPHYEKGVSGA